MATLDRLNTMSGLPAQEASSPATKTDERARFFFNSGNAFNLILPAVPNAVFADEPRRAMDPATPIGVINCDASAKMQCAFPAQKSIDRSIISTASRATKRSQA